ncbi:MAG TPA: DNA-formamidopyrimidine glycosylase family protein [Bacteroidia bacterium]|jgi:endonuclease-8
MPEGPSIVILREETASFAGKRVLEVSGNAKIPLERLKGKTIRSFRSWGKHFLICFDKFYLRVHFLLFGSYRINERRTFPPRMSLLFSNGELNFYNCSIKFLEGDPDDTYDWSVDVMSDEWDPRKAKKKLLEKKEGNVSDILLDQEIFSGSGNIIKNEILFRIRVHPLSTIGSLPLKKRNELVKEARNYSFDFYEWKKVFQLRKHWQVYKQKMCPRCDLPLCRTYLGKTSRLTFYCPGCQVYYGNEPPADCVKSNKRKTSRLKKQA